jgi:hypothetical protein
VSQLSISTRVVGRDERRATNGERKAPWSNFLTGPNLVQRPPAGLKWRAAAHRCAAALNGENASCCPARRWRPGVLNGCHPPLSLSNILSGQWPSAGARTSPPHDGV